jgi:Nucleotidyltransferase substrate binding protein like
MRNITSHTYDEAKALQVVAEIPAFLKEATEVAHRLAQSQSG